MGCGSIPKAFFSQAPGPVGNTVSFPDLKSGIPVDVDIPAPVKAIKCAELLMISASLSTFFSNTSGSSKYYFLSRSLWAVYILHTIALFLLKRASIFRGSADYPINYWGGCSLHPLNTFADGIITSHRLSYKNISSPSHSLLSTLSYILISSNPSTRFLACSGWSESALLAFGVSMPFLP